jgi:hypothetical protein
MPFAAGELCYRQALKSRDRVSPSVLLRGKCNSLGRRSMASIFEAQRSRWQSERRTALVSLLLSPKPSTLLIVIVLVCTAWTAFVAWGAVTLLKLFGS